MIYLIIFYFLTLVRRLSVVINTQCLKELDGKWEMESLNTSLCLFYMYIYVWSKA